jgi:arylsulfatase A-like enzyme
MLGRRILGAGVNRLWTGASAGTRRIVIGAALLAALGAVAMVSLATGAGGTPPPNILVIVTDDQRADGTMDVMPQTRQWFETGGTTFSHAYVADPQCCPSRSAIFSGRYVHNHGVRTNDLSPNLDQRYTLQRYLHDAGYTTGAYGKYLNAWNLLHNPPSFDKWSIFTAGYSPLRVNEQGVVKGVSQYATSYISDKAVQFLQDAETNDSKPWFLYLATTAPHSPFTPETKYANASVPAFQPNPAESESDRSDKPAWVQNQQIDSATNISRHDGQLRTLLSVDDLVNTVFQTLEATGEASDTLAIFISDNGYEWGDHGLTEKGYPYDESVRVPMYMRWPSHVATGATDSRLVNSIDLTPTILDAVGGITPGRPLDGKSLFDAPSRTRLLTEFFQDDEGNTPTWASLVSPTYQYNEYYSKDNPRKILYREYYGMTSDPYQLNNLLADGNSANDPPTASLSAQLAADVHCSGSACP